MFFFCSKHEKTGKLNCSGSGEYNFFSNPPMGDLKKAAGRGTYQRESQPMGIPPLPYPSPPLPTYAPPPPLSRSAHTVISHFSPLPLSHGLSPPLPLCTSAYETSIMCFFPHTLPRKKKGFPFFSPAYICLGHVWEKYCRRLPVLLFLLCMSIACLSPSLC